MYQSKFMAQPTIFQRAENGDLEALYELMDRDMSSSNLELAVQHAEMAIKFADQEFNRYSKLSNEAKNHPDNIASAKAVLKTSAKAYCILAECYMLGQGGLNKNIARAKEYYEYVLSFDDTNSVAKNSLRLINLMPSQNTTQPQNTNLPRNNNQ